MLFSSTLYCILYPTGVIDPFPVLNMTVKPRLPPELTDRIIGCLRDDPAALSACGLTCSSWLPSVRFHRYSRMSPTIDCPDFLTFLDMISHAPGPDIGGYFQRLTLKCRCYPRHKEDDRGFFALMKHFENSSTLRELRFNGISTSTFPALSPSIVSLEVTCFGVRSFSDFRRKIGLLPALHSFISLMFWDPDQKLDAPQDIRDDEDDSEDRKPSLTDLQLLWPGSKMYGLLAHWAPIQTIRTLSLSVIEVEHFEPALLVLRQLGPSLESLEIIAARDIWLSDRRS